METYVLKKESPADLAKKYTGDPGRYVDLFSVNELTPSVDGMTGKPAFQAHEWREGRRITIPDSWTRPGVIGRVALTDKTVGTVGWGPSVSADLWQSKHPTWAGNGTNLVYWSQIVNASVKFLATFPASQASLAAKTCLAKTSYWADLYAFLKTWQKPSQFVAANQSYNYTAQPEGVSYASPGDANVASTAAYKFVVQCGGAHEYTRTLTSSRSKNSTGPTFTMGQSAGPGGMVGDDPLVVVDPNAEWPDPDQGPPWEPSAPSANAGKTCTPNASGESFKPYYYIVTAEDLNSFWAIPKKFNMDPGGTGNWTWHQMRAVNTDWSAGFVNDAHGVCVFRGLRVGSKLRVPASWTEPGSGVKTEIIGTNTGDCPEGQAYSGGKCVPKGDVPGIDPVKLTGDDSGTTVLALLAVVGLAAVGGVYLYKQRNKR